MIVILRDRTGEHDDLEVTLDDESTATLLAKSIESGQSIEDLIAQAIDDEMPFVVEADRLNRQLVPRLNN